MQKRTRSCHGCRALRQGCSRDCTIRPCLQWITSPQSQANATYFLSKYYGRAGLINLIASGPAHLRPEIFKSLLHEACGRIINPINGSVGLLRSSDWPRCEAAVEAVLRGASLAKEAADDGNDRRQCRRGDIRHVSHGRVRTRNRIKRTGSLQGSKRGNESEAAGNKFTITGWGEHDHDSLSVETANIALAERYEQPGRARPSPICETGLLELNLGLKDQI